MKGIMLAFESIWIEYSMTRAISLPVVTFMM